MARVAVACTNNTVLAGATSDSLICYLILLFLLHHKVYEQVTKSYKRKDIVESHVRLHPERTQHRE